MRVLSPLMLATTPSSLPSCLFVKPQTDRYPSDLTNLVLYVHGQAHTLPFPFPGKIPRYDFFFPQFLESMGIYLFLKGGLYADDSCLINWEKILDYKGCLIFEEPWRSPWIWESCSIRAVIVWYAALLDNDERKKSLGLDRGGKSIAGRYLGWLNLIFVVVETSAIRRGRRSPRFKTFRTCDSGGFWINMLLFHSYLPLYSVALIFFHEVWIGFHECWPVALSMRIYI